MIKMEEMNLNLGSRDRIIPDFMNMDIDAHDNVDFVGDVSNLSRFRDESIGKIFASNILEHFSHRCTLDVLMEWHRVLKPGGILYLSVPNFSRAIEIYKETGLKDWVQNFICGDQEYKTAFHYAIFDEKGLKELVLKAGFKECSFVEFFNFADEKDCSRLVSNVDLKPVCLNAVIIK